MLRSALLASAVLFVSVPSTAWADEQAGGQGSSAAPLAGATFRHCRDCPDMVVIPAGKVAIGSAQAETDRENMPADQAAREHPQKTVTIARPFALAQTEVTVGQYAAFAVPAASARPILKSKACSGAGCRSTAPRGTSRCSRKAPTIRRLA